MSQTQTITAGAPEDLPPTYAMSVGSNPEEHIANQEEYVQIQRSKEQPGRFSRNFHSISSKIGWPLNKAANVIGAEGWWPTSMAKECRKAARILHSFTGKYHQVFRVPFFD